MAHKKGVGSSDNGRDSKSKRLGVKLFGGQTAKAGNIIIRQRGTKFHPGENTYLGKDFTLHAQVDGVVTFTKRKNNRTYVSIMPQLNEVAETLDVPSKIETPAPVQKQEVITSAEETSEEEPTGALTDEQKAEANQSLLSSIGTASIDSKDDLKKIKGVGPKLEETLNDLGIFTFEQVSKMTDKEYDLVDSLMDSFKGRGKRDDWAGQASELK